MGRIIAVVNQKGGVGKTTTAVSLAAALAIAERNTLLVDADPQANSTRALGFEANPDRPSLYEAFQGEAAIDDLAIRYEPLPHLRLVPADRDLVGIEVELVQAESREYRLSGFLGAARSDFDHILIDCPPSLGLITLNALVAADAVLIPVQCEYLALEGISQLMETIDRVREVLNPELAVGGVLMTMFDERTNLSRQVVDEVRRVFGNQVFQTVIPRNVRLGEAPSHGKPVFLYDIRSKGAESYLDLAKEFLEHEADEAASPRPRAEQPDSASPDAPVPTEPDADGRPGYGRTDPGRHRPRPSEPETTA